MQIEFRSEKEKETSSSCESSQNKTSSSCESSGGAARSRKMELQRVRFPDHETQHKRRKEENHYPSSSCCEFQNNAIIPSCTAVVAKQISIPEELLKFGSASVCGRRRDMEDAVAIHPCFIRQEDHHLPNFTDLHYFAVFDGHGCSHIATKCRDRLHEVVKDQFGRSAEWKKAMERSFELIDKGAIEACKCKIPASGADCRCEHMAPQCNTVGSTAVVAVLTRDKIIIANCGDSRAVLCRNGKAIPLSSDHKPDRPDELNRIQSSGGQVIYSEGPRVFGVLAMSRAIGDNFLKPYVTCETEITITDWTPEDDCLILASDGLWDVVTNDVACGVAKMCLCEKALVMIPSPENEVSDKACAYASMLLTKLALARHSTDNVSVVVVDLKSLHKTSIE